MSIPIVQSDLLNRKEDYLMHQCNCLATRPHGLSTHVFRKYPEADIYTQRVLRYPGKILVRESVINLLGQYYPGGMKYKTQPQQRFDYFKKCLDELEYYFSVSEDVTIAFPYKMGCGLAGGDWKLYKAELEKIHQKDNGISLVMYQRKEDV